jgi:hypothetical protein
MRAYLDTNAFDHLYKKIGCGAADIANLRKKIYGRDLSIRPSLHILSEILLDRRARPELLVARVKLTLSLANFRQMVKPCSQLLADDVRSYASRGEADRPYISADLQNIISSGLSELIETDGEELDEDMVAALESVNAQPPRFHQWLTRQTSATSRPSFDDYFQDELPQVLEGCAASAGVLHQCRTRGLHGLMGVSSIRGTVGAVLSLGYGQSFDGWAVNADGSFGLRHVPCAAAVADTFVTNDKQLAEALARVPLERFEVIDLPGFLARLK